MPSISRCRSVASKINDEEIPFLPTFQEIDSSMYRARATIRPQLPKTLQDVQLGPRYATTKNGEDFLLESSDPGLIIFTTRGNLELLTRCQTIYMDGTFKTAPLLWRQLYTVHGFVMDKMVPLVFVIMAHQTEGAYSQLLNHLKRLAPLWTPSAAQIDFEMAMKNALETAFEGIHVKGCSFHFTQSLWRKAQGLGMASAYKESRAVHRWFKRFCALALLPMNAIDDVAIETMESAPDEEANVGAFQEYFVRTYLDDDALYPRSMWNHWDTDGKRNLGSIPLL